MARRFAPNVRTRGPRRLTDWIASTDETDRTALAAATSLLDQSLLVTVVGTIVRTRGMISVWTDQVATSESPFGALGMGIVSAEAATAGAASIPAPYSNASWDGWMVHQYFHAPMTFGDATGFAALGATFEFDSKAMRKITPDDVLVVMVENASASDGLLFNLDFRILKKES